MRVKPASTDQLLIDWGATGATLGVRVLDNSGATTIARTTGFVEYPAGSGVYYLDPFTFPDTAGSYTLLYDDDGGTAAVGHTATEELIVSSSAPDDIVTGDTFATTAELFRILKVRTPTADQTAAAERVLFAAAGEIRAEIDIVTDDDLAGWELALCEQVNLDRAADLWRHTESIPGITGLMGDEGGAILPGRYSWERYAQRLAPLKRQWGLA